MLARHLEFYFEYLDELPDSLYKQVVTLRHGRLVQRVKGVLQWRAALSAGELPQLENLSWPQRSIAEIILKRLDGLELTAYCRNEESLVDHILKDICTAVESIEQWQETGLLNLFDDVLPPQLPRPRQSPSEVKPEKDVEADVRSGVGNAPGTEKEAKSESQHQQSEGFPSSDLHEAFMNNTASSSTNQTETSIDFPGESESEQQSPLHGPEANRQDQNMDVATAGSYYDLLGDELHQSWQSLAAQWREIDAVFRGMGTCLGRGWDLSQGVLVSDGWRELMQYRKLMKNLPELLAIVNNLGREQVIESKSALADSGTDDEAEIRHSYSRCQRLMRCENPMSTQGITRSDDVARMLPQEAVYLGHAKLHMLWHAKRAEQGLLSYQVQGVLSQHQPEITDIDEEIPKKSRKQLEETVGPIMLCIDTSASMHGKPERVAKALALEVLRLANERQRTCYLYAFSGPNQVLEQSMEFTTTGLKTIIRFLQQSFHGGTDISEPINRALNKIKQQAWNKADVLLISDGRFVVPDYVVDKLRRAREQHGLRIRGISIGRWNTQYMAKICESVYTYNDLLHNLGERA